VLKQRLAELEAKDKKREARVARLEGMLSTVPASANPKGN